MLIRKTEQKTLEGSVRVRVVGESDTGAVLKIIATKDFGNTPDARAGYENHKDSLREAMVKVENVCRKS